MDCIICPLQFLLHCHSGPVIFQVQRSSSVPSVQVHLTIPSTRMFEVTIMPTSVVFFCINIMCADISRIKYLIKVNLSYNTKCEVMSDLVNPEGRSL